MLRSLNSALRQLFAPTACVGLAISPREITAAHGTLRQGQWQVDWVRQERLEFPLFTVPATAASIQALSTAVGKVAAEARRAWLPVQIALPDPLFHAAVFPLEDVPKDRSAREQLVAWRLKKDLHLADEPWAYRSQDLGDAEGKRLLLGVAMEQAWLGAIESACRQAGITPTWIDMASGYYFHRLSAELTQGKDSALAVIDDTSWSLTLIDAAGRMRYLRARWRREGDAAEIAGDIERATRAYIRAGAARAIERVLVSGEKAAGEPVMDALRARLRGTCVWVDMPGAKEKREAAATAIAAAAYRA